MDQVGSHVNKVKDTVNRLIPVLQQVLLVLDRSEVNHPIYPVDSARYGVVVIESAQLLLAVVLVCLDQLRQSN